jgi:outer membrane protein OmpA-like peptidoglycan-associated protein
MSLPRVFGIALAAVLFLGVLGSAGLFLAFRLNGRSAGAVQASAAKSAQAPLDTPGESAPTSESADSVTAQVSETSSELVHCPAVSRASAAPQKGIIPLRTGLTIVDAWHVASGDFEMTERVETATADSVRLFLLGDVPSGGEPNAVYRTICREELQSSHLLYTGFMNGDPEMYPGTTIFSVSAAVFEDLKTKGRASLTYTQPDDGSGYDVEATASRRGVAHDGRDWDEWSGELARVEPDDVQVPVIVNDQRVNLSAIHAKGTLGNEPMELWVADDPLNPVTLRFVHQAHNFSIQVVKLSFPTDQSTRIEQSLKTEGSAEIHGINFDFASDQIRADSEPVLKEIADALKAHPEWTLRVEGHTDNIGGDAFNLDLSKRRAEAVKQELVTHHETSPARLSTAGFGASRPKESNDTLEGRARNRRVELVRQ